MINVIIFYTFSAIVLAIGAFIYSNILTGTGEVLGWLYGFLDRLFKTDERAAEGKGIHPLFKMLMQCEKCVAGQWGLWSFLIYVWPLYKQGNWILFLPHLGFIFLSIFFAIIVKKIYVTRIK
jgi:hypothetical protein